MATDGAATDLDLIDWGTVEDAPRLARRDRAFIGVFVAFPAGATAYTAGGGSSSPVLGFWDPLLVDWMFYAALLVFGFYVVWPLVQRGPPLRRSWSSLHADRIAIASLGWLAVFVLVGTAEPLFVRSIPFNPLNQPPPPSDSPTPPATSAAASARSPASCVTPPWPIQSAPTATAGTCSY